MQLNGARKEDCKRLEQIIYSDGFRNGSHDAGKSDSISTASGPDNARATSPVASLTCSSHREELQGLIYSSWKSYRFCDVAAHIQFKKVDAQIREEFKDIPIHFFPNGGAIVWFHASVGCMSSFLSDMIDALSSRRIVQGTTSPKSVEKKSLAFEGNPETDYKFKFNDMNVDSEAEAKLSMAVRKRQRNDSFRKEGMHGDPLGGNYVFRRPSELDDKNADFELPNGVSFGLPDGLSMPRANLSLASTPVFSLLGDVVEGCAFVRLLNFLYTGEIEVSDTTISQIVRACNFLDIPSAKSLCEDYLLEKLQPSNALSICAMSNLYDCATVEEEANKFLSDHFMEVTQDIEWTELSRDAVQRLLSRDNLVCHSEASVVRALYRWAKNSPENRSENKNLSDEVDADMDKAKKSLGFATDELEISGNRVKAFREILHEGFIRFPHLSDVELVNLTDEFSSPRPLSPILDELLGIWNTVSSEEKEKRGRHWQKLCDLQNAGKMIHDAHPAAISTGIDDLEDEEEELYDIPNSRRYAMVAGYEVERHKCILEFASHSGYVYAVSQTKDGSIVSGSRDQTICVWDSKILKDRPSDYLHPALVTQARVLEQHTERVFGLLNLSNGLLASCSFDQDICIWDTDTWTVEKTLEGHEGWVVSLAEINGYLCSGAADNLVKVWNMSTWHCEFTLEGHTDHVYGLTDVTVNSSVVNGIEGSSVLLVSGSRDASLIVWDPGNSWCNTQTIKNAHKGSIRSVIQCGRYLASCSADKTVRLWTISGKILKRNGILGRHSDVVESLEKIPQSGDAEPLLASASRDTLIKLWNTASRCCVRTFAGHRNWVKSLKYLTDNNLASASADGTVRVWDLG